MIILTLPKLGWPFRLLLIVNIGIFLQSSIMLRWVAKFKIDTFWSFCDINSKQHFVTKTQSHLCVAFACCVKRRKAATFPARIHVLYTRIHLLIMKKSWVSVSSLLLALLTLFCIYHDIFSCAFSGFVSFHFMLIDQGLYIHMYFIAAPSPWNKSLKVEVTYYQHYQIITYFFQNIHIWRVSSPYCTKPRSVVW